ncbi:hypothetical protein HFP43_14940 [Streptomyces sp. SJ1-7]|nr:hypothetical protein [Streptomyces sp. SJ1-7]
MIKAQAKRAADKRAREAAAQERKEDGIFGNIMKGRWGAAWDNSGGKVVSHVGEHWRGYAQIAAFAVCVAASAGACLIAGAALVAADNIADAVNYKFSGKKLVTQTAWLALGGGIGRGIAGSWRGGALARGPVGARPALWRGNVRPAAPKGAMDARQMR